MRLRRVSAAVAILLSVVSILGRWTHEPWVETTLLGMRLHAAIAIGLLGVACFLPARWARPLGLVGMMLGLVSLLGWAGSTLHLGEALLQDGVTRNASPAAGRISAFTALALMCLGGALAFPAVAAVLAAAALLVGFIPLVARLYGVELVGGPSIALSTAVALMGLSVAVLAGLPQDDPIHILFGDSIGGRMARRILPLVIAVPLLTGLLGRTAERMGWMTADQRLVAVTVVPVILLVAMTGFVATRMDAYEAARRDGEAHFRYMVDALPLGLWCAWPDGHVFHVNTRWRSYTGRTGESWLDSVHPDDRERAAAAMAMAIASGNGVGLELRLLSAEGVARTHMARIEPIRGPDEGARMWIGTFADVEDRRRAENEAIQTQRMEIAGLLAGGVAHDFNNLLAGVNAHAGMARRKLGLGNPIVRHVDAILEASSRGAYLTRQLLGYAGKGAGMSSRISLGSVLADVPDLVRKLLPPTARLHVERNASVEVVADVGQLHQLIVNLVLNSGDALQGREGDIHVRAFAVPAGPGAGSNAVQAAIEVRDTGVGLDEATRARVFEPFFTTKPYGRGLGLAAVAGIVRSHGGTVSIDGAPGQGSVVTVLLPAVPTEVTPVHEAPEVHAAGGRILLVEDDPEVRKPLRETLELLGYGVIEAVDGPEAIERFRVAPEAIDLVLLDLVMPKMNGEEVLRQLRTIRADVPIVISSGFAEDEVARRLSSAKVDGVLPKPWTVEQLSGVLARIHRRAEA